MNSSGLLVDPCQVPGNATKDGLLVVLACNKRMLAGIVNVTRDFPLEYAKVMFGYIMPILLLLTLFTNTLVIIVLAQKHMRTPTNIVLFTMAIADLFTLIPPAPWYIYLYTLGHYDKYLYPPDYCYAYHYMTDVIPIYFHTASIWLALLLAGQRYVYVCHPNLAKTWCTVKHVKMAIVFIFVVDFIHQSPKFFDNTFISVYVETDDKKLHLACKNVLAEWAQNTVAIYLPIYYIFRIVFVYVVPCSMLIYINMVLLFTLRKATCRRTQLKSGNYAATLGAAGTTCENGPPNAAATAPGTATATTNQQCNTSSSRLSRLRETNASFAQPTGSRPCAQETTLAAADCSNNNSETNKSKTTANTTIIMLSTPVKEDRFTFSERLAMHFEGTSCESEEEMEATHFHSHNHNHNYPADLENHKTTTTTNQTMRLSVESNVCTCSTSATNSANQVVVVCPHQQQASHRQQASHTPQALMSATGSGRYFAGDSESVGREKEEDAGSCPECMVCERSNQLDQCKHCMCVSNHQLYTCSSRSTTARAAGQLHLHGTHESSHCSSWQCGGATTTNGADEECGCQFGVGQGQAIHRKPLQSDTTMDEIASRVNCMETGAGPKEPGMMAKSRSVDMRILGRSHHAASCGQVHCSARNNNCYQQQAGSAGRSSFEPLREVSQTANSSRSLVGDTEQMKRTGVYNGLEPTDTLLTQDEESSVPVVVRTTGPPGQGFRVRVNRLSVVGDLLRSARDNLRASIIFGTSEGGPAVGRSSTSGAQLSRTIDSNRTTLMLIVVVFVFLFVEVPVAAATIVHVVLNLLKDEHEEVDYTVINNIKLIGNFLIIVSYSINFTIYCSMSKKFRDTFKELFLFRKKPKSSDSAPAAAATTNRYTTANRQQQQFNYFASKADIQMSSKSQPPISSRPNETTATVQAPPSKRI